MGTNETAMPQRAIDYTECTVESPPDGLIVATKIDDAKGCRNEDVLLSRTGNLWFIPDGSMYVYYTPTHWRSATKEELGAERRSMEEKARVDSEISARQLARIDAALALVSNTSNEAGCRECGNEYYHTIDCPHWIKRYDVATPVEDDQRIAVKKKRTKLVQDFHREDEERVTGYE